MVKTKIFISHWGKEKLLAEKLRDYIKSINSEIEPFCYDIDSVYGKDSEQYESKAENCNIALLLISPYCMKNPIINYEAGIVRGSSASKKVIPILYGGAAFDSFKDPIKKMAFSWGFCLEDKSKFNNFMKQNICNKEFDYYNEFIQQLNTETKKILSYGIYGLNSLNSVSKPETIQMLNKNNEIYKYQRFNDDGEVVSIRLKMIPRNAGTDIHWKTGITLINSKLNDMEGRVLQVHGGEHNGYQTWTVYLAPVDDAQKFNIPAKLELNKECGIYLVMYDNGNNYSIIFIDSDGVHTPLINQNGLDKFTLISNNWDTVELKGWCDSQHQQWSRIKYQTDISIFEIERDPTKSS